MGYFLLARDLIARHGVPLALYSDKHATFRSTKTETLAEQLTGKRDPTQFGRAMNELGVSIITAHSPQAKGRVERLWGTLQGRLVTELRLARISTIEAANDFLPQFIERFNTQFAVVPSDATSAYRDLDPDLLLDAVLCVRHTRTVAHDNTVRFPSRPGEPLFFQVLPGPGRRSYSGQPVELCQYPDGSFAVLHEGRSLAIKPLTLRQRMNPQAAARRQPSPKPATSSTPSPPIPAKDHPWRNSSKLTKSLST